MPSICLSLHKQIYLTKSIILFLLFHSFGEIYKCKWKGTLVAAKCIKSAKIRKEWSSKFKGTAKILMNIDDATEELDEEEKEYALEDFRHETAILSKLRWV